MKFVYDENKTMRLLGHQFIYKLITGDNPGYNEFMEVLEAHRKHSSDFLSVAIDIFSLGFIWGIRNERAKRRRKPRTK